MIDTACELSGWRFVAARRGALQMPYWLDAKNAQCLQCLQGFFAEYQQISLAYPDNTNIRKILLHNFVIYEISYHCDFYELIYIIEI